MWNAKPWYRWFGVSPWPLLHGNRLLDIVILLAMTFAAAEIASRRAPGIKDARQQPEADKSEIPKSEGQSECPLRP
jgi:hypothetical protein